MKNHILQSIIEAAKQPTNRTGIAAINQLIIEVASEFPGVAPAGFGFTEVRPEVGEPHYSYFLHARLVDPWPLEKKEFCGLGNTPCEAMKSLRKELVAYFVPVEESAVLNCREVQTYHGQPVADRRTEITAA